MASRCATGCMWTIIAAASWRCCEKGREGEIYNIGGNRSLPNLDVVHKVLDLTGKPESLIEYVKDRPGHDRRYALSSEKLMHETGWRPSWILRQAWPHHRLVSRQRGLGGARAQRRIPYVLREELRQPDGRAVSIQSPMRVAIEAASLGLSSGGLARYTRELRLALARCFPDDEFFLTSDQPFRMPPGAPPNLTRGGGPRNTLERRWWLWGLAREMGRLGADLIHGPDFAVPYIPARPSVLTLHDLSPWMDQRVASRPPSAYAAARRCCSKWASPP